MDAGVMAVTNDDEKEEEEDEDNHSFESWSGCNR